MSVSSELEGQPLGGGQKAEGIRKSGQLYGGKPAFEVVRDDQKGEIEGLGFDESKTRGL